MMSRYQNEDVRRFDQQFAEGEGERNARLRLARQKREQAEKMRRLADVIARGENSFDAMVDLCRPVKP